MFTIQKILSSVIIGHFYGLIIFKDDKVHLEHLLGLLIKRHTPVLLVAYQKQQAAKDME